MIELGKPAPLRMSLEEALQKRRSKRRFKPEELSIEQLSALAWAAQGISDSRRKFRTAPSAGATFPLNLYIALDSGVYLYEPEPHRLRKILDGDLRKDLARACWNQMFMAQAPAIFIYTGVYARIEPHYGDRSYKYMEEEVGHSAQNLLLAATALGLAGVPIGAYDDDAVAKVLALPKGEVPLYLIPIGYPR